MLEVALLFLEPISQLVALKSSNPKLKVLLAVGGWNQGSIELTKVVASPSSRSTFTQHAIALLRFVHLPIDDP